MGIFSTAGKFTGMLLLGLVLIAVFCLPGGFILMLLLGGLSDLINVPQLAIGFWASYVITLILARFTAGGRSK